MDKAFQVLEELRLKGWCYNIGTSARGDLYTITIWKSVSPYKKIVKNKVVHDTKYSITTNNLSKSILELVEEINQL